NALMRAIPTKRLAQYVDNLNSPHAKRFRREVLESLWVATPDMLRELDTDVIEDMNVRSLGVREHRALIYVLRGVGPKQLRHILASNNGKNIQPLLEGGLPVYSEDEQRKDLMKALAAERGEQQEAVADKARLAAVETTLNERFKVLTDFIVTDAEATRVLDWIASFYPDEAMIAALTRRLETMGRLDRLLDELPDKVIFDRFNPLVPRTATWLTIL